MISFDISRTELTDKIKARLSKRRFEHTLGVCAMAERLAEYCLPDHRDEICVAAMLHDIAKEIPQQEQLNIMRDEKIGLSDADTPAVYHSYVAPYIVRRDFPEFATPNILSAVARHTVGDEEMTVFDEIIFLADYIEQGRTYPDCVEIRELVLSSLLKGDVEKNITLLHKACIASIDRTCKNLLKKGKTVNPKSLDAKKALEARI